jgi:hypothetical protein
VRFAGKSISPQRHGDTEKNTNKKVAARVHAAASSPAFESTEVAEITEKHTGAQAIPGELWAVGFAGSPRAERMA